MQKSLMIRRTDGGKDDGISDLNNFLNDGWEVIHVDPLVNNSIHPACFVIIEKNVIVEKGPRG